MGADSSIGCVLHTWEQTVRQNVLFIQGGRQFGRMCSSYMGANSPTERVVHTRDQTVRQDVLFIHETDSSTGRVVYTWEQTVRHDLVFIHVTRQFDRTCCSYMGADSSTGHVVHT
jgi:hypothetical protein